MTSSYWSQWSSEEIDSMHGIEPEDCRDEEELDPSDYMDEQEDDEEYDEPVSMESLGMSWRDFM